MSHTEGHHLVILLTFEVEQSCDVEPDDPHQLLDLLILLALQAQLLSERLAQPLVRNRDGLLDFLLDDVAREELGEGLGDLALHEFGDALEGVSSALELVEIFEGKAE